MFRNSLLSATRNVPARSFSSTSAAQLARVNLIGRLIAQPEQRQTRNGKSFARYVIATNDPPGPPNEDGSMYSVRESNAGPATPTSSFHNIFAFGETVVDRLLQLPKGTLMYVEGDFKVGQRQLDDGNSVPEWLIQHKSYNVLVRPKNPEEAAP
ncbi:ssDNA-binding protein, mitochondrial [Malassezia psittaci]|uniref:Single-stranded DNA-binding protein n=1 Tax=Malassezia psittaci TaxID=1821823 RepID=A0AAF0FCF1_9BASI|nr:ssDNA-binding protein, mitochondrial [Malassezia psittaci]